MLNSKKGELLQSKLNELISFKSRLNAENLDEFNNLKKEVLNLLDDNQKLRFNQINFYNVTQDYSDLGVDDLPF
jgi:flagellar biosynthesis/type III secretory pathway chaperone